MDAAPVRILTITLNPALDLHLDCSSSGRSDFLTADSTRRSPGGKGVNVARQLHALGTRALALFPCGTDPDSQIYRSLIEQLGFPATALAVPVTLRTNITIDRDDAEGGAAPLKINQPGAPWPEDLWPHFFESLSSQLDASAHWLVLAGSLPPGVPVDAYAQLTRAAHERGLRVALDCDGPALAAALKARPDLLKINREELAATLGLENESEALVLMGIGQLCAQGIGKVVITHGGETVLASDGNDRWQLKPPQVAFKNAMGAGDAMMGGLLHALDEGRSFAEALRIGVATAAVTTTLPSGEFAGGKQAQAVFEHAPNPQVIHCK